MTRRVLLTAAVLSGVAAAALGRDEPPAGFDLTVQDAGVIVRTRDRVSVWFTLRNAGAAPVPADAVVGVVAHLAADEAGTGARLGTGRVEPDAAGLAPGETMMRAFSVVRPEADAGADWFLVRVRVPALGPDADPANDVFPLRADAPTRPRPANVRTPTPATGGPDLTFESLHLTGRTADKFEYRYVLRNAGSDPVPEDVPASIDNYLSPTREIGSGAKRAHGQIVWGARGLAPGETYAGRFWATRQAGNFRFLVVRVGLRNRRADADPSNDTFAVSLDAPLEPLPAAPPPRTPPAAPPVAEVGNAGEPDARDADAPPLAGNPAAGRREFEQSDAAPPAADSPDAGEPNARGADAPPLARWVVLLCPLAGVLLVTCGILAVLWALRSDAREETASGASKATKRRTRPDLR